MIEVIKINQENLIELTGSFYVDSCPGSGKTQTIVERYKKKYENKTDIDSRKGIALITYTNDAVDEAKSRFKDVKYYQHPNYIGTTHQFLYNFFILPVAQIAFSLKNPSEEISEKIRNEIFGCYEFFPEPSKFFPKRYVKDAGELPSEYDEDRKKLSDDKNLPYPYKDTRYKDDGYITADNVYELAEKIVISQESKDYIKRILKSCFFEIIVDEVQDINNRFTNILSEIIKFDVPIISIGDAHQQIYGFKDKEQYKDFDKKMQKIYDNPEQYFRLSNNYRSSQIICDFTTFFRKEFLSGSGEDTSKANIHSSQSGIYICTYNKIESSNYANIKETISSFHEWKELSIDESIVLSRTHEIGSKVTGQSNKKPLYHSKTSKSKLDCLIRSIYEFGNRVNSSACCDHHLKQDSDRNSIRGALKEVGEIFYRIFLSTNGSLNSYLESIGLSRTDYDLRILRLCMIMNENLCEIINKIIEEKGDIISENFLATLREGFLTSLRQECDEKEFFKNLSVIHEKSVSMEHCSVCIPPDFSFNKPSKDVFEYNTIHGFKGLERNFVVVIADNEEIFDLWNSSVQGYPGKKEYREFMEEKRKFYVAISRAKRYLLLVLPEKSFKKLEEKSEGLFSFKDERFEDRVFWELSKISNKLS